MVKPEKGSVWWPRQTGPALGIFGRGPPEAGKGGKGGTWGLVPPPSFTGFTASTAFLSMAFEVSKSRVTFKGLRNSRRVVQIDLIALA